MYISCFVHSTSASLAVAAPLVNPVMEHVKYFHRPLTKPTVDVIVFCFSMRFLKYVPWPTKLGDLVDFRVIVGS